MATVPTRSERLQACLHHVRRAAPGRERPNRAKRPHSKDPSRQRPGRSRHETETSACRGEWRRGAHSPRKRARPIVCRRERARGERPPPKFGPGTARFRGLIFLRTNVGPRLFFGRGPRLVRSGSRKIGRRIPVKNRGDRRALGPSALLSGDALPTLRLFFQSPPVSAHEPEHP